MLTAIFGFVLTTGLLVFIHEYGHYLAAKFFGVKIEEFSIGFGKELISFIDKAKVRWKVCLIPLGGFVKMYKHENYEGPLSVKESFEFYAKAPYQRLIIILAGPFANFVLAFVILTGIYYGYGKITLPPVIEKVIKDSPAEKAGLLSGDILLEVQDVPIADFIEFRQTLTLYPSLPIKIKIKRESEISELLVPSYLTDRGIPIIGIQSPKGIFKPIKLPESMYYSIKDIFNTSKMTFQILAQMLLGQRSSDALHGPFTIAKESAKSINNGVVNFFGFVAMISINLGFINILPIPVLDGGHAMFTLFETVTKKQLSKKLQNTFNKIGLAIIIFLIIISTTNDIKDLLT